MSHLDSVGRRKIRNGVGGPTEKWGCDERTVY